MALNPRIFSPLSRTTARLINPHQFLPPVPPGLGILYHVQQLQAQSRRRASAIAATAASPTITSPTRPTVPRQGSAATTTAACRKNIPSGQRPFEPGMAIVRALRSLHSTPAATRDHHFDTLKFVQRLQDEGFTQEQSVATMNVLCDVIEESVQNLTRTMVLKEEQEKITYTQKVDFSQLRSDLQTHHSLEYTSTHAEYERLSSEIAKLNSRLREEMIRAQNSFKLDLNLEKGRIREEASVQELRIKETDTRIETEVGAIRGTLETVKFSTLQWLIGVCTGTAALILGVWRMLA